MCNLQSPPKKSLHMQPAQQIVGQPQVGRNMSSHGQLGSSLAKRFNLDVIKLSDLNFSWEIS